MKRHKKVIAMLLSCILVFSNTSLTMADESITAEISSEITTESTTENDNTEYQVLSQEELDKYFTEVGTSTDATMDSNNVESNTSEKITEVITEDITTEEIAETYNTTEEIITTEVISTEDELVKNETSTEGNVEEAIVEKQPTFTSPIEGVNVDDIDFSSKQLLIGTEDPTIFTWDTTVLSSYNGVYLTEYTSEEETKNAYTYYYNKADFVDVNITFTVSDNENSEESVKETADLSEINTGDDAISNLNDMNTTGTVPEGTIAVIDTGSNDNTIDAVSLIGDSTADDNGHGTKVINAIQSAYPNAKIVSIKALGSDGRCDVATLYAAISYAIEKKVSIINLSVSSVGTAESDTIREVIDRAVANDIVVVGAAGNNGKNAKYYVPGGIDSAIIVGSYNENGEKNNNSNYGPTVDYYLKANSTSIAAAKMSAVIAKDGIEAIEKNKEDGYIYYPASEDRLDTEGTVKYSHDNAIYFEGAANRNAGVAAPSWYNDVKSYITGTLGMTIDIDYGYWSAGSVTYNEVCATLTSKIINGSYPSKSHVTQTNSAPNLYNQLKNSTNWKEITDSDKWYYHSNLFDNNWIDKIRPGDVIIWANYSPSNDVYPSTLAASSLSASHTELATLSGCVYNNGENDEYEPYYGYRRWVDWETRSLHGVSPTDQSTGKYFKVFRTGDDKDYYMVIKKVDQNGNPVNGVPFNVSVSTDNGSTWHNTTNHPVVTGHAYNYNYNAAKGGSTNYITHVTGIWKTNDNGSSAGSTVKVYGTTINREDGIAIIYLGKYSSAPIFACNEEIQNGETYKAITSTGVKLIPGTQMTAKNDIWYMWDLNDNFTTVNGALSHYLTQRSHTFNNVTVTSLSSGSSGAIVNNINYPKHYYVSFVKKGTYYINSTDTSPTTGYISGATFDISFTYKDSNNVTHNVTSTGTNGASRWVYSGWNNKVQYNANNNISFSSYQYLRDTYNTSNNTLEKRGITIIDLGELYYAPTNIKVTENWTGDSGSTAYNNRYHGTTKNRSTTGFYYSGNYNLTVPNDKPLVGDKPSAFNTNTGTIDITSTSSNSIGDAYSKATGKPVSNGTKQDTYYIAVLKKDNHGNQLRGIPFNLSFSANGTNYNITKSSSKYNCIYTGFYQIVNSTSSINDYQTKPTSGLPSSFITALKNNPGLAIIKLGTFTSKPTNIKVTECWDGTGYGSWLDNGKTARLYTSSNCADYNPSDNSGKYTTVNYLDYNSADRQQSITDSTGSKVFTGSSTNITNMYFNMTNRDVSPYTVDIVKSTNNTTWNGYTNYSLSGTTIGLYASKSGTGTLSNQIATFKYNDESGHASSITINNNNWYTQSYTSGGKTYYKLATKASIASGKTFYYKELNAGKGYILDNTSYSLTFNSGETSKSVTLINKLDGDPLTILVNKYDNETNKEIKLTSGQMKIEATFYPNADVKDSSVRAAFANNNPTQTTGAITKTFTKTFDGSSSYINITATSFNSSWTEFPYGYLVIKETSAPSGYATKAYMKSGQNNYALKDNVIIIRLDYSYNSTIGQNIPQKYVVNKNGNWAAYNSLGYTAEPDTLTINMYERWGLTATTNISSKNSTRVGVPSNNEIITDKVVLSPDTNLGNSSIPANTKYAIIGELYDVSSNTKVASFKQVYNSGESAVSSITKNITYTIDSREYLNKSVKLSSVVKVYTVKDSATNDNCDQSSQQVTLLYTHNANKNDTAETLYYPTVSTSLKTVNNTTNFGVPKASDTTRETITFANVPSGTSVKFNAVLYDVTAGKEIQSKSTTVSSTGTASQTATIDFTYDSSNLGGHKLSAAVEMQVGNSRVLVHNENYDVEAETIYYPVVSSNAIANNTGTKIGDSTASVETIIDTVTTKGYPTRTSIQLVGELYDITSSTPTLVKTVTLNSTAGLEEQEHILNFANVSITAGHTYSVKVTSKVANHTDLVHNGNHNVASQKVYYPTGHTTAHGVADTKLLEKDSKSIVKDDFYFNNLLVGKTYYVTGDVVIRKADGTVGDTLKTIKVKLAIASDGTCTATYGSNKSFEVSNIELSNSNKTVSGIIKFEFEIDSTVLDGVTTTTFEKVDYNNKTVFIHADINDKSQQTHVMHLETDMVNSTTATNIGIRQENETLEDVITFSKVPYGTTIKILGTLKDYATGKDLVASGHTVKTTDTFTVSNNGSISNNTANLSEFVINKDDETNTVSGHFKLTYKFDSRDLADKKVVSFVTGQVTEGNNSYDVVMHNDLNDGRETTYYADVHTNANDINTKTNVATLGETTIVDTVTLTNLVYGKTYTVEGVIHKKNNDGSDAGPLKIGDNVITTTATVKVSSTGKVTLTNATNANFAAGSYDKTTSGTIDISFAIDSSLLKNTSVVAFEELKYDNITIAMHTDITDKGQTVHVPDGGTTAIDDKTRDEVGTVEEDGTVILPDTVHLENMPIGHTYKIEGILMDKSTGNALEVDGNTITSEATFTINSATKITCTDTNITWNIISYDQNNDTVDMDITIPFTFTADEYFYDKDIVVFETGYFVEGNIKEVIFEENDINNMDQTVHFAQVMTLATDDTYGDHTGLVSETESITEKSMLTNLVFGKEYEVTATVMDQKTGEAILDKDNNEVNKTAVITISDDGKTVTAVEKGTTTEYTVEIEKVDEDNKTIDIIVYIPIVYDSTEQHGKDIVIFEDLYHNDVKIKVHHDLDDTDEQIHYYELNIYKQNVDDPTLVQFTLMQNDVKINFSKVKDGYYLIDPNGTEELLIPDSDGLLVINGFNTDPYILTEIKTEKGKNLLKDSMTLQFIPSDDTNKTTLNVSMKDKNGDTITIVIENNDDERVNKINMAITNNGVVSLNTGGMGTTIFYILAILLILMSIGLIIFKKKSFITHN